MDCGCRADKIPNVVTANEQYFYCSPLEPGVIFLLLYYIIRLVCFLAFKENSTVTGGGIMQITTKKRKQFLIAEKASGRHYVEIRF
jgi:hypothetical protein